MALPEERETRLACVGNALANYRFAGYVRFKERVDRWLRAEFPTHSGRAIARLLFEYVKAGGTIDEQIETRAEYASFEYHFDLRVQIEGRYLYFETILLCDDPNDPDDPVIEVVNVHDA